MENNYDFRDFNAAEDKKEEVVPEETNKDKKPKKEKKAKTPKLHYSSKQVTIIAIACVVLALLIVGITVCAVNDVNPVSYIASVVTNDKKNLVAKWQSQSTPGLSAYVFNEDGTYDSYISSFKFTGEYETKGDRLILINPESKEQVEYKYSVRNDVLSMTLAKENNKKVDSSKEMKFDRVDTLNQKTIEDLIGSLTEETTQPAK